MKKSLLLTIFVLGIFVCFAQNIEIPKNYKFENASDYQKHKTEALKCIDWLDQNKFDQYVDARKEAYNFVYQWIILNPDYSYSSISTIVADIMNDKHPFAAELIMAYMMGEIVYAENNKSAQLSEIHLAGIKNMIEAVDNNSHLNFNSKAAKKYSKLIKDNKFESWHTEQINNKKEHVKKNNKQILEFNFWFKN